MVLLSHGIFSFGETAREAYERMIELVTLAEKYLESKRAWSVAPKDFASGTVDANAQTLFAASSPTSPVPAHPQDVTNERTLAFAQHPRAVTISQQDRRRPIMSSAQAHAMLGTDVGRYVAEYQRYFGEHASKAKEPKTMLDPRRVSCSIPRSGWPLRPHREGCGDRGRDLRPHYRCNPARRSAWRLPGAATADIADTARAALRGECHALPAR